MDLSVNNYQPNANFKAKLLTQGLGNKKFWKNVAKDFEKLTSKAPNDYFLLKMDEYEHKTLSNMGKYYTTCYFKEKFNDENLFKLGSEKVAQLLVNVTKLLRKESILSKKFSSLMEKAAKSTNDIAEKVLDEAFVNLSYRGTNNLNKMAKKNGLIREFVSNLEIS